MTNPTLATPRRNFLTASAAAAVAMALPPSSAVAAPAARKLKLGVASYSLRKFPLERAIEACRQLDVHHVTLKDFHLPLDASGEVIDATVAKLKAAGIEIMGGGNITMKKDDPKLRAYFEYARRAGFPVIVASPDPEALDAVEGLAKEFDIKVAIHNHGPEDKLYPAPQDAYQLIKKRDARLGLCVDVGHTVRAGVEPQAAIRACRDRVYDVHLKDLRVKTERDSQVRVGRGALDIPAILRALLEIGFTGHAALEYEIDAEDPVQGMAESLGYLRGVADTLPALG